MTYKDERDLFEDVESQLGDWIRASEENANKAWGSLTNTLWTVPGECSVTLSFRTAANLIAALRGDDRPRSYAGRYSRVPSGVVDPHVSFELKKLGWVHEKISMHREPTPVFAGDQYIIKGTDSGIKDLIEVVSFDSKYVYWRYAGGSRVYTALMETWREERKDDIRVEGPTANMLELKEWRTLGAQLEDVWEEFQDEAFYDSYKHAKALRIRRT